MRHIQSVKGKRKPEEGRRGNRIFTVVIFCLGSGYAEIHLVSKLCGKKSESCKCYSRSSLKPSVSMLHCRGSR